MKKKILIFILVILIISGIVSIFFIFHKNNAQAPLSTETQIINDIKIALDDNGIPQHIVGKYSNTKIVDEQTALESLKEIENMLNIENVNENLYLKEKYEESNVTYYEMQQKYNGIDVLGGEITISVDKEGNILGINSDYIQNIKISSSKSKTESEIKDIIRQKYGENTQFGEIEKVIYPKGRGLLVYMLQIATTSELLEVIANAKDGSIIAEENMLSNITYTYTGPGVNDIQTTITMNQDSDKYEFYDKSRNIILSDARGLGINDLSAFITTAVFASSTPMTARMDANGELTYYSNSENALYFLKSSVTTMKNMQDIYDFYKNVLGRDSYDDKGSKIILNFGVYEDMNLLTKGKYYQNAAWFPLTKSIYIGAYNDKFLSTAKDVLAHEFTHGVVQHTAKFKDYKAINENEPNYSKALDEAYADILGVSIDGKNWQIAEEVVEIEMTRSLENPGLSKNPSMVGGEYFYPMLQENQSLEDYLKSLQFNSLYDYDAGGAHHNSTVVSHAAYLMYEKGAFKNKNELAKVWYSSLKTLSSYSNFEDCAYAVIQAAVNEGLSQESIDKIKEAFYETKMLSQEYYNIIGKVVDDDNNQPIKGVEVTAINQKNVHVNFKVYTDENGEYIFEDLPKGEYEIVFETPKYQNNSKKTTLIKNTDIGEISLEKINEENYKSTEVVFVMDISMSMDENDPTDIRKQIIVNILGSMDNYSKAALVTFAKNGKVISDGLNNKSLNKKIIMTDVFNIINDTGDTENSGTNGKAGLKKAIKLFDEKSKSRKYIVFITDGEDNVEEKTTYEDIIKDANDKNIRILTIGLGESIDSEYLKKVSEETNGKYYYANSSTNLYEFDYKIFNEIK